MAANNTQYAVAYVLINNAILLEQHSVSFDREGGRQRILTTAKGWAGTSGGAAVITYEVANAVPQAGLEVDLFKAIVSGSTIELGVLVGTKVQKIVGTIMKDSFKGAVNSPSEYAFTGEGRWDSSFE